MVHCIVYFSSSVRLFQEEDIQCILQQSRHHNAQAGITGVLLYLHGNIIQVLEGDKKAVAALYQRIEVDPRHRDVTCVLNHSIQERLFSTWSMGYQTLTTAQFEQVKRLVDLDTRTEAASQVKEPVVLKTLKAFYQINRHD